MSDERIEEGGVEAADAVEAATDAEAAAGAPPVEPAAKRSVRKRPPGKARKKRRRRRRWSRTRKVLVTIDLVLVFMLVITAVLFVRALTPPRIIAETIPPALELTWIRSIYGWGSGETEQLRSPSSVAVGVGGAIYVNDIANNRILVFSPTGSYRRVIQGASELPASTFLAPTSIDVDEQGTLYVADARQNKVFVLDSNDQVIAEWEIDGPARGVSVAGDSVYVLSLGTVHVFDRRGALLGTFGERGPEPGQIDAFQGVTGDGQRIYVADALNARVTAFDRDGAYLWAQPERKGGRVSVVVDVSEEGTQTTLTDSPYDLPQDIVIDGAGRLVVIDAFAFSIVVAERGGGAPMALHGRDGTEDGAFFYPTGIAYDAERDWFVIADTRNDRVQIVRIPDSGASVPAAIRRALTSQYLYCVPPGLLGLIVLIIAAAQARAAGQRRPQRRRARQGNSEPGGTPEPPVTPVTDESSMDGTTSGHGEAYGETELS